MSISPSITVGEETTAVAVLSARPDIEDKVTAVAPSPFDNQYGDADVILQTSDMTNFYVHKHVLRISSTFFRTMFSLPQPNVYVANPAHNGPTQFSNDATLDIVRVSEDSRALESVLRWCYPLAVYNPPSSTVAQISLALAPAQKYDMEHVVRKLTKKLHTLRHHRPLEVYAEAYYRDLDDIARDAANSFCYPRLPPTLEKEKQMPTFPIDTYSMHMDGIPAFCYYRLLEHHSTVAAMNDLRRARIPPFRLPSRSPAITEHMLTEHPRSTRTLPLHPFHDDPRADTVVRSSDGSEFFVSANLLSYSSPVLKQMLTTATDAQDPDIPECSPHQLNLPEDGPTLALLLQLCYPMGDPSLVHGSDEEKLADLSCLLDVARKYQVARAVDFVRKELIAIAAEVSPMGLYFLASRQGWEDGMQEAAMRCVYEEADRYVPEMKLDTAAAYRRLLVYRQRCREIILACYPSSAPPEVWRPQASRAKYFSKQSWLSDLPVPVADGKLWLAVHKRVRENLRAARDPAFNVAALYTALVRQHNGGRQAPSLEDFIATAGTLVQVQL